MKLPTVWRGEATKITRNTELDDKIRAFEREIGDTLSFRKNDDGSSIVECDNTLTWCFFGDVMGAYSPFRPASAVGESDEQAFDTLVKNMRENQFYFLNNPGAKEIRNDFNVGYFCRQDVGVRQIHNFEELKAVVYTPSAYVRYAASSVMGALRRVGGGSKQQLTYDK